MSAFALYAPSGGSEPTSSLDHSPSGSDGTSCSQEMDELKSPSTPKSQQKQIQRPSRYPSMSECDQSIAAASALVGENLLDSPTSKRMSNNKFVDNDNDNYVPSKNDSAGEARNGGGYADSRIRSFIDAANVGVIASGWAWVKRQRDRRQREYLQHQAALQVRKISEAQEAEGSTTSTMQPRSLDQNSTYKHLTRSTDDIPNVVEVDAEEKYNSQDLDQSANSGLKVTSARISKSGFGISVSVQVPSDWQEEREIGGGRGHRGDVWIPHVRVDDENENLKSYPFILTQEQMQDIASAVLPLGISHCLWKRIYSLARDGDSFETCLRLVGNEARSLMVLRTTRGAVFGGYADSPWEMSNQQVSGFHGSAQACLFTFFHHNDHDGYSDGSLVVYKWTGANRYFQLLSLERKMLAFGGGGEEGSFGLCVEQDFQLGSTGCCDTFGNQPLCDQENFYIVDMEIWCFVTGRF